MPLEAGTWINDLVISNPVGGTDTKSEGDDHLRLIKTVLKNTFPGAVGAYKFQSTDAGAGTGPNWSVYRNSATPAAADLGGSYDFLGKDSAAVETLYARWQLRIDDPTNASEDASILGQLLVAGVFTTVFQLTGTGINSTVIGAATPAAGTFTTLTSTGAANLDSLSGAGKPPTQQLFTINGTWTKPAGCKRIIVEGIGGGGGSGAVNGGGAGTGGATGGGGSGAYGFTPVTNVEAIASAAVTIGQGGAAGAVPAGAGGAGGMTRFNLGGGTIVYDWLGGSGSPGFTANASPNGQGEGGLGGTNAGTHMVGSHNGERGTSEAGGAATGGMGAGSMYGRGGEGAHTAGAAAVVGGPAVNFGSGGGGSCTNDTTADAAGRAGNDGVVRVWEFY